MLNCAELEPARRSELNGLGQGSEQGKQVRWERSREFISTCEVTLCRLASWLLAWCACVGVVIVVVVVAAACCGWGDGWYWRYVGYWI